MAFDLYAAFVPTVRQHLEALPALIDKAEGFAAEGNCSDADLLEARLAEDMWPLPWHIRSCWMHSAYALDQLVGGAFTPDFTDIPGNWDAMRAMVAKASERLASTSHDEVNALEGRSILVGNVQSKVDRDAQLLGERSQFSPILDIFDILRVVSARNDQWRQLLLSTFLFL